MEVAKQTTRSILGTILDPILRLRTIHAVS